MTKVSISYRNHRNEVMLKEPELRILKEKYDEKGERMIIP
jgi:hypothetical protein